MIKKPFNFLIGICCTFAFLLAIVLRRDTFTIAVYAVAAVSNIAIGLWG
jgi:hypothetical protein